LFTEEFSEDAFVFQDVHLTLDGEDGFSKADYESGSAAQENEDSIFSGAFSRLSRKSHFEMLI
jgi:hypothetical protein